MIIALAMGILWTVSLTGLVMAAVSDFKNRIIPNRLVVLTVGCGLAMRLLSEFRSLWLSVAVAIGLLFVFGMLAHWQLLGGGDAKLMAAVTLLVPPGQVAALLLLIAIAGGLLSCIYLLAHLASRRHSLAGLAGNRTPGLWFQRQGLLRSAVVRIAAHRSIPYGLAILTGTAVLALTEGTRWLSATS